MSMDKDEQSRSEELDKSIEEARVLMFPVDLPMKMNTMPNGELEIFFVAPPTIEPLGAVKLVLTPRAALQLKRVFEVLEIAPDLIAAAEKGRTVQ